MIRHFGPTLPDSVPVGHLGKSERAQICENEKPDRRLYEIATLAQLRDRLNARNVWGKGSRSFRPIDEHLMPTLAFVALKEDDELGLGVQSDVPVAADALNAEISGRYPLVEVPDLLREVHEWPGFADQFTHVRTGGAPQNLSAMLAGVHAEGTNLSPKRMAGASKSISAHQIGWMRSFYARSETYRVAQATVTDAHTRHPHSHLWGDPSICQLTFDHAKAQRKLEIQPYDFGNALPRGSDGVDQAWREVQLYPVIAAHAYTEVKVTAPKPVTLHKLKLKLKLSLLCRSLNIAYRPLKDQILRKNSLSRGVFRIIACIRW